MDDFLELKEFLELEDGEKHEDLDSSREDIMEDFLELEQWLEDMDQNLKKKLDDDKHTSRGDLETSPKASIVLHQPDEIDRQPPHIIDRHPPYVVDQRPPYIIDRHPPDSIKLHLPDCIDRHPWLDELPGYIVELEQVEERVHESEASHNADSKHLRPLICAEEAAGFHKIVKRIHDLVKFVVPCALFEAESPIPPDRSMQFSSYNQVLDDHQHVEASQRGLRFTDEVDKGPVEAASVDTNRIPLKDTTDAISNEINKPASIDTTTSSSIDTGRVSEPKEFDVYGNLFDGETTTRSDKSGGKKTRNWKKRKRIMGDPQLSFIPHLSDGVRKSRVCRRCFSQPFTKLRALLIADMIDKGEESMEEAFTQKLQSFREQTLRLVLEHFFILIQTKSDLQIQAK